MKRTYKIGGRFNERGKVYGKLQVLKYAGNNGTKDRHWVCLCECGNMVVVAGHRLRSGKTKSCGCLRSENMTNHGESFSVLYNRWRSMRQRCRDENTKYYHNYGGRGIRVCNEWENNYTSFRDWSISNGYSPELEIDRIDNDGNYCPENCRWVTHRENSNNKRKSRMIKYDGITMNASQWAGYLGVSQSMISNIAKSHGGFVQAIRYYKEKMNA